jgi:hypothetical protein
MEYSELIQKVKELFIEHLDKTVKDDAIKANSQLTKQAYLDVIYTEIMSLGYNFGNVEKATNDIYEMKSALHGESQDLKNRIQKGVVETLNTYPFEIKTFSDFHKSYQKNIKEEVLINDLIETLNK